MTSSLPAISPKHHKRATAAPIPTTASSNPEPPLLFAAPVACVVDEELAALPGDTAPVVPADVVVGLTLPVDTEPAGIALPDDAELVLPPVELAVALASFSKPVVMVTGMKDPLSVPGLNVLVPGSFAPDPTLASVHRPGTVPEKSQCAE